MSHDAPKALCAYLWSQGQGNRLPAGFRWNPWGLPSLATAPPKEFDGPGDVSPVPITRNQGGYFLERAERVRRVKHSLLGGRAGSWPLWWSSSVWDERYAGEGYFYGTEANDFLRAHAGPSGPAGGCFALQKARAAMRYFLPGWAFRSSRLTSPPWALPRQCSWPKLVGLDLQRCRRILTAIASNPAVGMRSSRSGVICQRRFGPRCTPRSWMSLKPGGVFILEAYRTGAVAIRHRRPQGVDMLPTLAQLRAEVRGWNSNTRPSRSVKCRKGRGMLAAAPSCR